MPATSSSGSNPPKPCTLQVDEPGNDDGQAVSADLAFGLDARDAIAIPLERAREQLAATKRRPRIRFIAQVLSHDGRLRSIESERAPRERALDRAALQADAHSAALLTAVFLHHLAVSGLP